VEQLPLLATKCYVPRPHQSLVPRPRLLAKLNEGLRHGSGGFSRRLTLVSAPAGFGKTTLLAEWAHTSGEKVAWLSLDAGDNDVARFLGYLVAALRQSLPEIGDGALALLGATRPVPPEQVLITLVNDLAVIPEASAPPPILILDDYHLITNPEIHKLLAFLLENVADSLHFILSTRADPPLPLARLRARRQMVEIRQADLAFTPEQAATFLNEVTGLGLSAAEVSVLHSRSEGWISGLQMAALALRNISNEAGSSERSLRVEAFSGSQRYILDYLLEEVLQRQPDAIQRFLLQTSVLPQLSASLCGAVLKETAGYDLPDGKHLPDAQAMLEHLEAANLFIVPLDDERRWYRYHHLFADLLCRRLERRMPEEATAVRRRASAWYEAQGLAEMAIEQSLAAGDTERAATLIERAAEAMLMRSELGTLLRLLESVPDAMLQARPRLRAFGGGALLLKGEPLKRVQPFLMERGDDAVSTGELAAFRALMTMLQGKIAESETQSDHALESLPTSSHFLRALVVENLGFIGVLRGDFAGAAEAFREAVHLGRESGNLLVAVGALCNLAGLHITEGRLHQAESVYQDGLQMAHDRHGKRLPIAGKALFGLGDLYREWNQLTKAGDYLAEAIDLFEQYGEMGLVFALTSLARVRLAQGDGTGAEALLQRAESQASNMDSSSMDDLLVDIFRIQAWLLQGDVEKAERLAAAALVELPVEAPQFRETADAMLARLRLAQGRAEEALDLLQPLRAQARQRGHRGSELKLSIPAALALEAIGEREEALSLLGQTLVQARPEGYMRSFLDEGAMPYGQKALPRLLYTAAERGIEPKYAGRLLAALSERPLATEARHPVPDGAEKLIEPLSQRELEVLQLIAAGLSNRAIAEQLVIAESTVKGHTSNIYGKLGVGKRTEAVARAQALGLLR